MHVVIVTTVVVGCEHIAPMFAAQSECASVTLLVVLGFSIFVVNTFTDEAPAKRNAPCICAMILPAISVAKIRVKISSYNPKILMYVLLLVCSGGLQQATLFFGGVQS